jgi:hypothetical protein
MKTTAYLEELLELEFHGTAIPNLADNAASSPATNLYAALHTTRPGPSGTQATGECAYTGYSRVAAARNSGKFTVSGGVVTLASDISFGLRTDTGTEIAKYWSLGTGASGATRIMRYGIIGSFIDEFNVDDYSGYLNLSVRAPALVVNDQVLIEPLFGSGLPPNLSEGTTYYVKSVIGNQVQLSLTQGGAVYIASFGGGFLYKSTPITIVSGVTPVLGTGTTIVEG